MDIKIIGTSKSNEAVKKDEFDIFGGRIAGLGAGKGSLEAVFAEDISKTQRRIKQVKSALRSDVFEHNVITISLVGIPKILAMMLAAEKQCSVSGMSFADVEENLTGKEKVLYQKWVDIFKNRIAKSLSGTASTITAPRMESIARYYSEYLLSVFTKTNVILSCNYKSFNYLIAAFERFLLEENKGEIETRLVPFVEEIETKLREMPYYDVDLVKLSRVSGASLFANGRKSEEYFGDVYSVSYKASLMALAESQSYRNVSYSFNYEDVEYYIPEIIAGSSFAELWISDLKELEKNIPQANIVDVIEVGVFDDFVLKYETRKSDKPIEMESIVDNVFKKYEYALRMKIHPRAEELIKYNKTNSDNQ